MNDELDLKSRKEAFVTGHGGSNHPWEVLWVCTSVLWGCWLYAELMLLQSKSQPKILSRFAWEACLVWLPVILSQTHYLYPFGSLVMVAQIVLATILCWKRTKRKESKDASNDNDENDSGDQPQQQHPQHPQQQLLYLTLYRSCIYFLTFCAILAVDFPLFPRRFCKTEISGYGLMDVGAASFVFSGGMVCGKAYSRNTRSSTFVKSLAKPLLKAAPLIAIGILRCVTNKELEYQEHVSEYGVHWNFFFTLGVLAVVPTIRRRLLLQLQESSSQDSHVSQMLRRWVFWAPLVAMVLYQYELIFGRDDPNGLEKFILTAPRSPELECERATIAFTDYKLVVDKLVCVWMRFFYANREGILGCIGYSFLHAVGEWVGHQYIFTGNGTTTGTPQTWPLAKLAMGFWMALYAMNYVFHVTASRRETNASFCLWAIAHNLTILVGFRILTAGVGTTNSILGPGFAAVNNHGLASFLVANLLTGLVNLLVPTIDQPDHVAMGILVIYLLAVGGAALILDKFRGNKTSSNAEDISNAKKTN